MSCCTAGSGMKSDAVVAPSHQEILHLSQDLGNGRFRTYLTIPDMHCGACIRAVEGALQSVPGVESARVNLSTRRATVEWRKDQAHFEEAFTALTKAGFPAHLAGTEVPGNDRRLKELLLALGVAGFAAGNVMLLSVSVWSGAEGSTRDLFHWISALIAIPAVGYAGRVFFRPALTALKAGRLNMDVPISLAVLLAIGMSLYETATHGAHAYFDASVTLLFFLLIGRTLDHVMRERARGAVAGLARLTPEGATVVAKDGSRAWTPLDEVQTGMRIALAAGERIPVDCTVEDGTSDIDMSIATGESVPVSAGPQTALPAGALNLTGPLMVTATSPARSSFLAEMTRMLEAAESAHPRYRRLADKAASLYAPVVHLAALASFIGWLWISGDWHKALMIAVAVLIVTCPCALGLAVPIVQVVAAGRLFKAGIMMRDGAGLEKLAKIDHVLFDKTGTLTLGTPRLSDRDAPNPEALALAASLARESRHPYAHALTRASRDLGLTACTGVTDIAEVPGFGLTGTQNGTKIRLGRPDWAISNPGADALDENTGVVLSRNGRLIDRFRFSDALRPGAEAAISALQHAGIETEVVSGDARPTVRSTADALGISKSRARMTPKGKLQLLEALQEKGHRVLMLGDGINDAPALASADVSMVPAKAADIGRSSASFVFLHEDLTALPLAVSIAKRAHGLVLQNFALAALYNMIAVPLAVLGHATPLVAALAMSGSSIVVTLNALRLSYGGGVRNRETAKQAAAQHTDTPPHKEAFA